MMVPAKQYQVFEAGFSAVGPVFCVVSIDKSRVGAARELERLEIDSTGKVARTTSR